MKKPMERHHWWPECVSRHWVDSENLINWILPDGTIRRVPPKNLAVISGGHFLSLHSLPGQRTPWDQDFEEEFTKADSDLPGVINWISNLNFQEVNEGHRFERFTPQVEDAAMIGKLIECVISLAVRSPRTRAMMVAVAEKLRGPLQERERNRLIAANLKGMHQRCTKEFGFQGNLAVIRSDSCEFLYGDGFYHNLTSSSVVPISPRILVPLTPNISVLYFILRGYPESAKLSTILVREKETIMLNNTVQVYANNALFFRNNKPFLLHDYRARQHRIYNYRDNPIENMINDLSLSLKPAR